MRLIKRVERSFVTQLVTKTRTLISNGKPVYETIAQLQFLAARHDYRAERLRDRLENSSPKDESKVTKILAVIALRGRAGGYLRSTAKFLRDQNVHQYSIRRMPRLFAVPNWPTGVDEEHELGSRDHVRFMEFSS